MGLIIPGAARYFGVEVTAMAAQFTWLTGGVFAGFLLSFVVFDYFSIKSVFVASYVVCAASIALIWLTDTFLILGFCLGLFGVAVSIANCASGTLITRLWSGNARQTVLVAQDAMFNAGGVFFSGITSWFVARQYLYSSTYLVIAGIVVLVLVLLALSDFRKELPEPADEDGQGRTEWNTGIVLMGVSLFLFMQAKISIFIWVPQYVEQHFHVDGTVSGQFMSNLFLAALIGSVAGTWVVSRINVKYLLYCFIVVSSTSVWLFMQVDDISVMLTLAFLYGLSVSATFNAYVAFAISFVAVPTHRNIAWMLVMSALGSSAAPLFSSWAVEAGGEIVDALMFCFVTLVVVMLTLFAGEMISRRKPVAVTG